jgi:hypothetical protein
MASSLIPERPLLISPTLAATIGLEEAVMLHVLSELQLRQTTEFRDQRNWFQITEAELLHAMPFWKPDDIHRVRNSLLAKGLIREETSGNTTLIAINQTVSGNTEGAPLSKPAPKPLHREQPAPADVFSRKSSGTATAIPADWLPDNTLFQQCEQQYQIPRHFISERIKSFVMFQRERGNRQYSWHNTFLKWIVAEWRKEQSYQGAKESESHMSADWSPSDDAFEILEHADIPRYFIEDAVAEFVLYWRERGLVTSTWNTKFIAHVRRQWAKFSAEIKHDTLPRLISEDFEPSDACYEVIAMANIDHDFAKDQLKEFILYWRDRKEAASSWNSRFLQHVKFKWANRKSNNLDSSKQLENTIQRMTDRSWAD